jgi:TonB family protein
MRLHRIVFGSVLLTALASLLIIRAGTQEKADVEKMPEAKTRAKVVYPEEAKKAGVEGIVYVQMFVDASGKVTEVKVQKSDAKVLEKAALDAARQWTFSPAISKERKPVGVWVTVPFKFKLGDGKEKDAKKTD